MQPCLIRIYTSIFHDLLCDFINILLEVLKQIVPLFVRHKLDTVALFLLTVVVIILVFSVTTDGAEVVVVSLVRIE